MSASHIGGFRSPAATIRGDALTRRVFTIRQIEGRWQVFDGEDLLADPGDLDLANAAAARLAREAFDVGTPVRVITER